MKSVVIVFLASLSSLSYADYYVTGKVEGNVCRGFGIEICGLKPIHAVKRDGQMYEVAPSFKTVSEYKESSKRCWIMTKNKGGGLISLGINAATQPDFYEKSGGEYKKIDADYITFPCIQR